MKLGIIFVGGVMYIMGLMTFESCFVNPLGATIWFAFVTLLATCFLLIMLNIITNNFAAQKRIKLKTLVDKERFYMTDFQARRGEWTDLT